MLQDQSDFFSDLFHRQTGPTKNRFELPCGRVSELERGFLQASYRQNDMPVADLWLRQSACRNEQSQTEYRLLPLEPTAEAVLILPISIHSQRGLIAEPLKRSLIISATFNALGCAPAFANQFFSIVLTSFFLCFCGRSTPKIKNGLSV